MVVEIVNIRGTVKTFFVCKVASDKSFFGIALLQYVKSECDSGFGLLVLKMGRLLEYRNRFGIKIKLLWWSWSWIKEDNENM